MDESLRATIISSETAERMLGRVSPIYDNSYVGLWIFEALGREYDMLWEIVREIPEQFSPETTTWALPLWEQRYGITPSEEQTLEDRRRALALMQTTPAPFTPSFLQRYIKNLTGMDAEIQDNIRPYTFGVYLINTKLIDGSTYERLCTFIARHKASHLSFESGLQQQSNINIHIDAEPTPVTYPMTGQIFAASTRQILM